MRIAKSRPAAPLSLTEYGTGAKAGALAGLISGVILGIALYVVSQAFVDTITTVIQNSVSANTTQLISVPQLVALVQILIPLLRSLEE
jgi:cell division protein FtsX